MTRTVASSIITKLSDDKIYPFYAVRLAFDGSPQYLWTGLGTITINSNSYTGLSTMLNISSVQESQDIAARGMTLTLSGIPSDLLSLALTEPYQGRLCYVYLGFMTSWENPDTNPDVMEVFSGYMDQLVIEEGAETSDIRVSVESRLIDLERPRTRRYTSQNQGIRFANDKAFDFVESLQNQRLAWGGG